MPVALCVRLGLLETTLTPRPDCKPEFILRAGVDKLVLADSGYVVVV